MNNNKNNKIPIFNKDGRDAINAYSKFRIPRALRTNLNIRPTRKTLKILNNEGLTGRSRPVKSISSNTSPAQNFIKLSLSLHLYMHK